MFPIAKSSPIQGRSKQLRACIRIQSPLQRKSTEKAVLNQLNGHKMENHLHIIFQSAYREGHITDTDLLYVYNDMLCAVDDKSVCCSTCWTYLLHLTCSVILYCFTDLSMLWESLDLLLNVCDVILLADHSLFL